MIIVLIVTYGIIENNKINDENIKMGRRVTERYFSC